MRLDTLTAQLDVFDATRRREALLELIALEASGELPRRVERTAFNLHAHTFFSYSGEGFSPSHLVWRAHRQGWWALASVDFDVLDGVDETLCAADLVHLRVSAGMETRVHVPELADAEINSPGEPGVMYLVGVGHTSSQPEPGAASIMSSLKRRAQSRNREMIERINAYLSPVNVDFDRDVAPLTPAGNATERHIVVAYDAAARQRFDDRDDLLAFWSGRLDLTRAHVDKLLGPKPFPHDAIRARLMKRGSVGYAQPGPDTFPHIKTVCQAIVRCGAVPTYAFLDGTSTAEMNMDRLLERMMSHGIHGLTLVPDRNWNIDDPDQKTLKLERLGATMGLAERLDIPVLAGTEMNKPGQREIDDFGRAEIRPFWPLFQRGAAWLWGHTVMQRLGQLGYQSEWAQNWLPGRRDKNDFYVRIGQTISPGDARLRGVSKAAASGPGAVLRLLDID